MPPGGAPPGGGWNTPPPGQVQPPWRPSHTGGRGGPGFNKPKRGGGCAIAAISAFALVCVAGAVIGLVFFLKGKKATVEEEQPDALAPSAEVVTPPPSEPEPVASAKPVVVAKPIKKDAGGDAAKAAAASDASTSAVTNPTVTPPPTVTAPPTVTPPPTVTAPPTVTPPPTTPTTTSTGFRFKVPSKK
jgi:hypothetical protein